MKAPRLNPMPESRMAPTTETFYRLKAMPAGLVQYSVEEVTLKDGMVAARRTVTERDVLAITMSKLEDLVLAQVRK